MKAPRVLLISLLLLAVTAALFLLWQSQPTKDSQHELRMLAYVGYDEEEFIQPLERALDARITVETYVGGEQMYTKFTEAPRGTYDVVVLDAEYGERLFAEDRLLRLDESLWHYPDLFPKFSDGSPAKVGDSVYAVVARWGALGLVFNKERLPESRLVSYDVLYDQDLKGRIGLYDWYLPNMGIISLSLGNEEPYSLTQVELREVQQRLSKLRSQVVSIQPSPGQVLAALRSGEVWLAPGIGEWAAAALASEGRPIEWTVPQEGGIMWVEAFSIATTSTNIELAKAFVREVMKPNQLALLATREAYFSQVTRESAYSHIPDEARGHLKAERLPALASLATQLQFRHLPGPDTTEEDWLAVWSQFKAGT